jgi:hypothetical protein
MLNHCPPTANRPAIKDSMDQTDSFNTPAKKRPHSVTILALGVLIITALNLLRFGLSLADWNFLASQPGVSPLYLAVTGFLWGGVGSYLVFGLWRGKTWAPGLMKAIGLTFALYYWLDLIFIKDHPVSIKTGVFQAVLPVNWKFSTALTIVCLLYMVWTLGRKKVNAYFGSDQLKGEQNRENGSAE